MAYDAAVYDRKGDLFCVCNSLIDATALVCLLNRASAEEWWP